MAVVLPTARHTPVLEQAVHAEVKLAPPVEKVPTGHLLAATVAAPVPAGQKKPAVQGDCAVPPTKDAQK